MVSVNNLRILPDGMIVAVHSDDLQAVLQQDENVQIDRASHVEFRNEVQAWFVEMLKNEHLDIFAFVAGPFPSRAVALAWESAYLEHRIAGLSDMEACRQIHSDFVQ